jgi:hypothetical protein
MRPPLTFETDFSREDFAAYQRFVVRRCFRQQRGLRFSIVLAMLVPYMVFAVTRPHFVGSPKFAAGALTMLLFVLAMALLNRRAFTPRPGGAFLQHHRFEFDDDGIRTITADRESFIHWQAVQAWTRTANHLFLLIDQNAAVIIPRRCFGGRNEEERLLDLIHARTQKNSES